MDFVARKTSKNTSYVGAICYGQMCPGGVEIFHMLATLDSGVRLRQGVYGETQIS